MGEIKPKQQISFTFESEKESNRSSDQIKILEKVDKSESVNMS